jgi:hypothetical protein
MMVAVVEWSGVLEPASLYTNRRLPVDASRSGLLRGSAAIVARLVGHHFSPVLDAEVTARISSADRQQGFIVEFGHGLELIGYFERLVLHDFVSFPN